MERHFAFIGMAHVADNYPLYYDAVNEKGLGIAGLNFVGNAHYRECREGKDNIAQWELIPWIMAQCASVSEAKALLARINLTAEPFAPQLPTAQLHWIISDKSGSITLESVSDGIFVYDNPVGVLTNNPPFPIQLFTSCRLVSLADGISVCVKVDALHKLRINVALALYRHSDALIVEHPDIVVPNGGVLLSENRRLVYAAELGSALGSVKQIAR